MDTLNKEQCLFIKWLKLNVIVFLDISHAPTLEWSKGILYFLSAKVNIWINMKLEHYLADIFRIKRKNLLNKSSSVCVGNRKWHWIGLHLTTWSIQRLSFATNFSHVYSCTNNVDIFSLYLLNDLFGTNQVFIFVLRIFLEDIMSPNFTIFIHYLWIKKRLLKGNHKNRTLAIYLNKKC